MDKPRTIIVSSTPDGRDSWFYQLLLEARRHPTGMLRKARTMGASRWELVADALAHAAAIEATVSGFAMYQLPHPLEQLPAPADLPDMADMVIGREKFYVRWLSPQQLKDLTITPEPRTPRPPGPGRSPTAQQLYDRQEQLADQLEHDTVRHRIYAHIGSVRRLSWWADEFVMFQGLDPGPTSPGSVRQLVLAVRAAWGGHA